MIHEFNKPVPCVTPLGDGYVWYVESSGTLENDVFTVILCEGGIVRHFLTDQINIWENKTFGINKLVK